MNQIVNPAGFQVDPDDEERAEALPDHEYRPEGSVGAGIASQGATADASDDEGGRPSREEVLNEGGQRDVVAEEDATVDPGHVRRATGDFTIPPNRILGEGDRSG